MNILVAGAWPYANGSLHVGHLAGILAGDVIARYHRAKGDNVLYVSGSDCHGTPISLRAAHEKVHPSQITTKYHNEFEECFKRLGFSYDLYSRTDAPFHVETVQIILKQINHNGYIYEREVEQLYCEKCETYLADRYIEGACPFCGNMARGDQCDSCGSILNANDLIDSKCKICDSTPALKKINQLFFQLSAYQDYISSGLEQAQYWRENAIQTTKRYLNEGLVDRVISRNIDWGIPIPINGYEDRSLYVWFDAVLGYLTDVMELAEEKAFDWKDFWNKDMISYYVHGKDNIPFHTVIFPALLASQGINSFPTRIVSNEYLTLEGRKISTSQNWAVWLPHLIKNYDPDVIRYYILSNAPEKRDSDFSWREFLNANNSELLGAWGNLVNRTLMFINNIFDYQIPNKEMHPELREEIRSLFSAIGTQIEHGNIKKSIKDVFTFIRKMNKYFDEEKPWITVKDDLDKSQSVIFHCAEAIANIAILLNPFLPATSSIILGWFNIARPDWFYHELGKGLKLPKVQPLYRKLDKKIIEEELNLMNRK